MTALRTMLLLAAAPLALAANPAAAQQAGANTESKAESALSADADASAEASRADGKAEIGDFGFDMQGMDTSIRPGDDFYGYANGGWAESTAIPADKSNYGMFTALADLSQERVKNVLEQAKMDPNSRIGRAFSSYLDTDTVEAKGLAPIQPWLSQIDGLQNKEDYALLLVDAAKNGVRGPVASYVGQDDKNPDTYIFNMYQAGLGLPDRDYYLGDSERFQDIRTKYIAHLTKMFELAGEDNAAARAQAVFDLEKNIAEVHWNKEDSSDATKTYNKMSVADLQAMAPGLDLAAMLQKTSPKIQELIVAQPSAVQGIARIIGDADMGVLKDQLMIRSLDNLSDVLPEAIANESFDFYGTTLNGTPEREVRWKRGVGFTEDVLGQEVGQEYAARYFPPETKAAMNKLVDNVLAAMGRRIQGLEWMQPETKERALAKLANFTVKVGYPDRWKDYGDLEITSDDLFGNQIRGNNWQYADNISKLGEPIRRWEWGMLPETVNAYANFGMSEVVFPAAILQPPFFDPNADPAINYGGIGAVIGHEISHHFDDQGSKYDENGRLSDWWTPEDVAAFDKATKALVAQYDEYEPLPGEHVKGEFTLGENIGDLAGLTVAYDAYRHSLNGKEAPVLDGLTGDQRFFLGWAQVWRRNYREANLSQRLNTDPHSPSQQRAWVVRNLDKWYDAFDPQPDSKLYLAPDQRVRIW
ncbi:M13 family metallopeptidase [Novosphingopyxis iocasae]|uniref:M13 family metallopeptidase n=1 Tax=Novosphingopyxis iocasae TaxID=2762729 RepID=UPI001651AE12|nr:M13 family metallopeptidase [Novosphingopyxis iocasae]